MSPLEWIAAASGIIYVVLSVRELRIAWAAYIASCALYLPVLAGAGMYLYGAVQLVFIALAVQAWIAWGREGEGELRISSAPPAVHPVLIAGTAAIAIPYAAYSGASSFPLALGDAVISFGSVAATVLAARKYTESWIYWVVINIVAVAVFAAQGLVATVILYVVNLLLSFAGLVEWRRRSVPAPAI